MIGAHKPDYVLHLLSKEGEEFRFTQDFATIILGSCSTGQGNIYDPEVGLSTVGNGSKKVAQRFWEHHLEGVEGNVLVVTECCGQYDMEQVGDLRKMFPHITFVAPRIQDYCDNFHWERTRKDLLRAGIIEVS